MKVEHYHHPQPDLHKHMRYLQHNELHLVKPKFQQMVIDAWNKNKNVPYGVTALSDQLPSDEDIKRARELANQYG